MALTEETPSAAATRKVTLKSLDGEVFEVEETVALELQTIKQMIEDDCADDGIPLPNVTSKILSKAAAYFEIKSLLELTLLLFLLLSKTNSSKYTRMLILETSDNVKFVINGYFIWHSSTLKSIIEKDSSSGQISHYHPNISSEVLQKVIEYCNKHASYGNTDAMVSPVAIARRFMACLIKEEVLSSSLGADLPTCLLAIIRKNFPWNRASRTFLKALPWQQSIYKLNT